VGRIPLSINFGVFLKEKLLCSLIIYGGVLDLTTLVPTYMRCISGDDHCEFNIVCTTLGRDEPFQHIAQNFKKKLKKKSNFKLNCNFDWMKNENRKVINNLLLIFYSFN
jgi:hypothetical protein